MTRSAFFGIRDNDVILPMSTKFHAKERFCELYAGRLEGKQLMNDMRHRAGNGGVMLVTAIKELLNISAENVQ